ncbi:FHA domain-containing protein [uncultured Hyphomonas sp.]|uniref:FHA domain-containing protein n=1 Tax=uncultured Hyphomonas sp. TaxID=225298 RepID=UPI002AAB451D|nr:FHA domain-containing protein [uncultured Hyphomonas sp.]
MATSTSGIRTYTVGRGASSELRIADKSVSRRHAEITVSPQGQFYVVDCNSTGGTWRRENSGWSRIRQAIISSSDTVRFGRHETKMSNIATRIEGLEKQVPPSPTSSGGNDSSEGPALVRPHAVRRNPITGDIESL